VTDIYHITHIDNLSGILGEGGLWSDSERLHQGASQVTIAYEDLKLRRRQRVVPVGVGGVLADYVPFYFCTRSPMLYAIARGQVVNYQRGQDEIIYLVSSVEQVIQAENAYCYTDGHALEQISRFFTDAEILDEVLDWPVIHSGSWGGTLGDPDRRRRKQAEFLVHRFFPLTLTVSIGVANNEMARRINEILTDATPRPKISIEVRRRWYYWNIP
jgi:hypothetical protein